MRLAPLALLCVLVLCGGGGEAFAASAAKGTGPKNPTLTFQNAFVRAAGVERQNTTAYMLITNNTDKPDALIGAATKVAEHVELHRIMNDHGLRRMHEIEEIAVPPHQSVLLQFGSYHLMLVGLRQSLAAGDKIPLDLRFAGAGRVRLMLPVVEVKQKKPSATR